MAEPWEDTVYPKILLVGDSGTHKTYFLGGLPEPYIFDFDAGMKINRGRIAPEAYDIFKDAPRGSQVVNPKKGWYAYGTAWDAFLKKINEIGGMMDKGTCPYKFLGMDSLTTMADSCMNYVLKNDNMAPTPQIQHWGAQIQLLQKTFDQLTSWPIGIVTTAHVQRNTNDVNQMVEMLPLVTGKMAGKIGIYFDEVWYTQVSVDKGAARKFTLQTESGGLAKQAKTRHGVPDGTITSWEAVWPYISGLMSQYNKPAAPTRR